jgi:hypothetical protein
MVIKLAWILTIGELVTQLNFICLEAEAIGVMEYEANMEIQCSVIREVMIKCMGKGHGKLLKV